MAGAASNVMRIVVLGKTGSGKSSLANTVLGEAGLFEVCHSSCSGTMVCQSETRTVSGRRVKLIDTPGLFDTDPKGPDFKKEILQCMIESAEGVHAFLLVLKVEKFTKHELSVAELFCQNFSDDALKYTTLVFTQGDQLKEGTTLQEWVKGNESLNALVGKCGGRCLVFDNRYWKDSQDPYRNNQVQLELLFKTIEQTVKMNHGRCYTNENLKMVDKKIKEEIRKIQATPESANMSEKEVLEKAKANTFDSFWSVLGTMALGAGVLLGMIILKLK